MFALTSSTAVSSRNKLPFAWMHAKRMYHRTQQLPELTHIPSPDQAIPTKTHMPSTSNRISFPNTTVWNSKTPTDSAWVETTSGSTT